MNVSINRAELERTTLREIAIGYKNATFIGDNLFPPQKVSSIKAQYVKFTKYAFMRYDTRNNIRSIPKSIEVEQDLQEVDLIHYGLNTWADTREIDTKQKYYNAMIVNTEMVTEGILLDREYQQSIIAQTAANYGTMTAVAVNKLNTVVNLIDEINRLKSLVLARVGRPPNLMVMGSIVFERIRGHAQLSNVVIQRPGPNPQNGYIVDEFLLQSVFGIDKVIVGNDVYTTDLTSTTNVPLWGNNVILAYVGTPGVSWQPSFGFTFELDGYPIVKTWHDEPMQEWVQVNHCYVPHIVSDVFGYLLTEATEAV